MKKIILLSTLVFVFANTILSQEKVATYMGYVELGAQKSMTSLHNNITGIKFTYNSVIKEKYVIGLNFIYAFENDFTKRAEANHLNNYLFQYINFGVRNKICNNFYITPSFGIGQANYVLTGPNEEDVLKLDLSGGSLLTTQKKYEKVKDPQIAVPINLNLMYTSKYIGIGLNLYCIASKYTEMGAGVVLNFGKIRN